MKQFIVGLLYENNEPSLTRCLYVAGFLLAVAVTVWCGVRPNAELSDIAKTTLTLVLGAKAADRIATFSINSVFNSPRGEAPKVSKNEGGTQS